MNNLEYMFQDKDASNVTGRNIKEQKETAKQKNTFECEKNK